MDVKKLKYIWKAVGIYLAFLAQSLIFENINIFSSSPDILLTVLIICCVSLDFPAASIMGAFAGIMMDAMYGKVFGVNTLIYMYLALLISIAADKKNDNSPLIMSWICFISITLMEVVVAILQAILGAGASMSGLLAGIFVKGLFAAIFALLYTLLSQFLKKRRAQGIVKEESL